MYLKSHLFDQKLMTYHHFLSIHCWQCCNWTYASCWIRWHHIQSVHRLLAKIQTYVATMHLKGQAQKLTPVWPKICALLPFFIHAYFCNKPFRHFPWYMLREVTKTKYFFRGERSPPTTLPLFKVHSECLPPRISKTPYQLWLIQFREGFIKNKKGGIKTFFLDSKPLKSSRKKPDCMHFTKWWLIIITFEPLVWFSIFKRLNSSEFINDLNEMEILWHFATFQDIL